MGKGGPRTGVLARYWTGMSGTSALRDNLMRGLILWVPCMFGTVWADIGSAQALFSGAALVAPCVPPQSPSWCPACQAAILTGGDVSMRLGHRQSPSPLSSPLPTPRT